MQTATSRTRTFTGLLAPVFAAALVGCSTTAPNIGPSPIAYASIAGDFITDLDGPCKPLAERAATALRSLGVTEVRSRVDGDRATITGKNAKGERVSIRLRTIKEPKVQAAIRWGVFGDEAASERLARELSRESPPAPR